MKKYESIKKALRNRAERSAWDKGVTLYALELLEEVKEVCDDTGKDPENVAELKSYALNGAKDWKQYSWGGCSLIYDCDIAARLCAPYELKKTQNGAKRPNAREEWLDVQARALFQAYRILENVWIKN